MNRYLFLFSLFFMGIFGCSDSHSTPKELVILKQPWDSIVLLARGSTVTFMMWQGNPNVNDYINNYVKPTLKTDYNISLNIIGGQGPEIVQVIASEKEAGVQDSQIDIMWINGETFFQLRTIDGLWGPFLNSLPNAQYLDLENKFIHTDFQQPINGMESPWGLTQFVMVYDSAIVKKPPQNMNTLAQFIRNNPGTFTISNDFSGMTLLKCLLAEIGGHPESLDGSFSEEKYKELSTKLWTYINELKPYLWKEGKTFPSNQSLVSQMFASGEISLTYGFAEGSIEERIRSKLYPPTVRGYTFENGTIRNTNYIGIAHNASNIAGALVVINFMISPEAQLKKTDIDGMDAFTVLDIDKLPMKWKEKFGLQEKRKYGPTMEELSTTAIQEPAPEYMLRLFEDFRTYVIEAE